MGRAGEGGKCGRGARAIALVFALACAAQSLAASIESDRPKLEERQTIPGTAQELTLTGGGVFHYAMLPVYLCGLYVPPGNEVEAALERDDYRRITLIMVREVSARTFVWALRKGLRDNVEQEALMAMESDLRELSELMLAQRSLEIGDRVDLDYVPERGTTVVLNGEPVGQAFPAKRFNDALLSVWLGEKPLDPELKPKLLGKQKTRSIAPATSREFSLSRD
jgi:hypothetical protein